jgi:sec-independent protein translocase protein TatA
VKGRFPPLLKGGRGVSVQGEAQEAFFMNTSLAVLGLGGGELIIVLVAILVLFGAKKIPEFAKGLGQGIKEFKKASSDVTTEFHNAMNQEPASAPPASKPAAVPETAAANPPSTVPKA